MFEPDLALQKPLEDYVEYTEKLSLRSIPLLDYISDPSFSFQDPYHSAMGRIEAQRILAHRLKSFPNSTYKVIDFMWGRRKATAYIYWSFCYIPNNKKIIGKRSPQEPLIMEGMSELKFLPDGKIYSCSEFWGKHSNFDIKPYKKPPLTK